MPRALHRFGLPTLVTLSTLASGPAGAQPRSFAAQTASVDLTAPIRALGEVLGRPVEIPTADGRGVSLVLLGDGDVVRAAWLTETPTHRATPTAVEIPRGVRLLGAATRTGVAYLLLESVASLDQPAGARGVVAVSAEGEVGLSDDEARALAWVDAPQALTRAVAALGAHAPTPPMNATVAERLEARMQRLLRTTSNSAQTFASSLSPSGARFSVLHQGFLHSGVATLTREHFAASTQANAVIAAARAAARMSCVFPRCEVEGFSVTFEQGPAGAVFVREVSVPPARLATPHDPAARAVVAASAAHRETDAMLRSQTRLSHATVMAQAPLTARGGTLALVLTASDDRSDGAPVVAVTEEHAARVYDLPIPSSDAPSAVRFADLDGDGRTDLIVQLAARAGSTASYVALTSPRPTMQARTLTVDNTVALAMVGAPDIDAAVRSALAVPARGVDPRAACGLLRLSNTLARWRRVASADARVMAFSEPGLPSLQPTVTAASALTPENISGAGATCPNLHCSPDRPYCRGEWSEPGPGSQHYWFTWERNTLRVQGFADYNGS